VKKVFALVVACGMLSACSGSGEQRPLEVTDPFRTWGTQFVDEAKIADNLASGNVAVKQANQLQYQLLSVDRTNRIDVTEKSPVVAFPEGRSYTAALLIPENISQFTFHLDSIVSRTVFVPTVVFYDRALNEVLRVEETQLDREGFLSMEQELTPQQAQQARYILVYSKATEFGGKTELIDPKVVYEEKTGGGLPPAFKYYSKHSPIGNLDIRLSNVMYSSSMVSVAGTQSNYQAVEATPVVAASTVTTTAAQPSKALDVEMLGDTEAFYLEQISKAVAKNDLSRALNLVEEAERAGSSKAQAHFMQQLKLQQQK